MKEFLTVLLANDNADQVEDAIKNIWEYYEKTEIVVLYHQGCSGIKEWCGGRNISSACYGGAKNFSDTFKAVVKENCQKDIFIMSAEIKFLPFCMERLQQVLYQSENVGAVIPKIVTDEIIAGRKYFKNLSEYAQKQKREKKRQIIDIGDRAVLISHKLLEEVAIEEKLIIPSNIMLDMVIQGTINGYHFYEVENAFVEECSNGIFLCNVDNPEGLDFHLLREKWKMGYVLRQPNSLLVDLIECKKEDFSVLEVGCSTGVNLLGIGNAYPKAQLYGVEINANAAKMASAFADVRVGNIEDKNLDFGDVSFDYIIFGDVLEHLHDPKGVLEYCKSFLAEGGKIIASIPNLMHWSVMKALINGLFPYADFGLLDRTHIHFFTYYEMCLMFTDAGYNITKLELVDGGNGREDSSKEIKGFVNQLMNISESAEEFMFWTFQYLIVAERV